MACGKNRLSIFREYILHLNDFPTEIINRNTKKFDFILGFASETGTGKVVPTWNVTDLGPQSVMQLKEKYPNKVRVIISIGGAGSEFNPTEPQDKWIDTAVRSITAIIKQYKLDGIDIHYDKIKSSGADFARYIGEVIDKLKNDPELLIKVVSIAPTKKVQLQYRILYSNHRDNIDWVDYRFYDQQFSSVLEFTNFYNDVADAYEAAGKVLAGISIPQDPIIFDGIQSLINNKLMDGVFVMNADRSAAVAPVPFSIEKQLQNL